MYGGGTHRRFTQESPIFPDVWATISSREPMPEQNFYRALVGKSAF